MTWESAPATGPCVATRTWPSTPAGPSTSPSTGWAARRASPSLPSPGGCNGVPNHLAISKSLDGGRTWSAPVDTPLLIGVTPRLRIDAANDDIYAVGQDTAGKIAVSASKNRGATWSTPAVLPEQPFGTQIVVQHGTLAAATGVAVTFDNGVPRFVGTDVIFYTSRDGGATFTAFPVTTTKGTSVTPATGPSFPDLTGGASDPFPGSPPTRRATAGSRS